MSLAPPLSDVAIANMAATTLEEPRLTSITDNTTLGRFMTSNYPYVRDEMLRMFPWPFAKARKKVAASAEVPEFDWAYKYLMPPDCIRVIELRPGGYYNSSPKIASEIEGRYILTNQSGPLNLIYVKRLTNDSEFCPLFARAFGERLAFMASQRITGKSSYTQKAKALYDEFITLAMHVNSLESGKPETTYMDDLFGERVPGL